MLPLSSKTGSISTSNLYPGQVHSRSRLDPNHGITGCDASPLHTVHIKENCETVHRQ